ncbi:MAG: alpha/beta fold hydrolase [Sandaracinaceae bacterium]
MKSLLLLHGFTGAPAVWDGVLSHLPTCTALRPALGGHGGPLTSWDEEVDRLLGLLEAHALEDVHVVGYSMGGRLAYGLLARRSSRITRATLIGAHPGLEQEADRAARRAADQGWIDRLASGLPAFVEAWRALPMWASQARVSDETREQRNAIRLAHDPAGLAHALHAYGLAAMPLAEPETIEVPVTLVAGELDPKHRTIAEGLVARFPNAKLAVIAGSGHDVTLEEPAALASRIEEMAP